ncbi:MAG: TauD/TfdA family dioxygenase [Proteobacteria bacterium]|nr:TauD/TfdA family dioxygenase [Pseudomonadota bacterium]
MADIYRKIIDDRCAWRSGALSGKEALFYRLTERHLDAVDEVLRRTRTLPCESISRQDFDHPVLNDFLSQVFDEIQHGRGAVIVDGCSPARYTEDDFTRLFWGFGTHFGAAVSQSVLGDRIGHVRNTPGMPIKRAYQSLGELTLHTDSPEIIGLMSVQKAKSGGYSQLSSALAIHNEILSKRPELLAHLYRGFPYHRRGQQQPGEPAMTPYDVPVFCLVDGLVSCRYVREFMQMSADEMGTPMPADLVEALDFFDAVAAREDLRLHFMLEPGEIMLTSNFTVLHARTAFQDHDEPERKRHLLRLWLDVPNGRPVVPEMDAYRQSRSGGRGGIARQEAKASAGA